jgi:hypothetical protein
MPQIIPKASLARWAKEKFSEQRPTVELIDSVMDHHDREAISIVALLEVDPAVRYLGMQDDEVDYVKSCHAYLETLRTAS